MPEATFVSFVPKSKRARLRAMLKAEEIGPVNWRERKKLFGSEFYFSGPPSAARQAHARVTKWLNAE